MLKFHRFDLQLEKLYQFRNNSENISSILFSCTHFYSKDMGENKKRNKNKS